MANRINLDVDLSLDPRFKALVQLVGCEFKAYGMMVVAIQIAQRYWAPKNEDEHHGLVPKDIWKMTSLNQLIDVGLAVEKEGGIYLKGAQERFEWIIVAQNNGRKGGRPKRIQPIENIEHENPSLTQPYPNPNPTLTQVKPRSNHTYTNTHTHTDTNQNTNTGNTETENLVKAWNENCGKLPKVIKLGPSRAKHAKARLKENPNLDYWVEIIKRIVASDFCNGQNSRQWVANIDFLLRPDTQFKALEGSYDNKQTKTNAPRKILDGDNIV